VALLLLLFVVNFNLFSKKSSIDKL